MKLLTYSSAGRELSLGLQGAATTLRVAADAVTSLSARAGLPTTADEVGDLEDLAGDWYHLDEFVGDVGRGFALIDNPNWDGRIESLNGGVITADNTELGQRGQLGFADRDDAVQQAQEDAELLERYLDDGEVTVEEMEALSDRVSEGQYDPDYAARFVQLLGPEGIVGVPGLIQQTYTDGRDHGDAPDGEPGEWAFDQLGPFSVMLSTALSTHYSPNGVEYDGPDPQNLHLDESWVDDFVDMGSSDSEHALDQSLLLAGGGDFPADVLVEIGNLALSETLREGMHPLDAGGGRDDAHVWGPDATTLEANVLGAIGENDEASYRWLNMNENAEAVLRYDPDEVRAPGTPSSMFDNIGREGASVFDSALAYTQNPHVPSSDLFDRMVNAVGTEDNLHFPEFAPALGDWTADHMDVIEQRVTEGWTDNDPNATPDFQATHDFLKAVMVDDQAAGTIHNATARWAQDKVMAMPGEGPGHVDAQGDLGRVLGVVLEGHVNAMEGERLQRVERWDGVGDGADWALGFVPGLGDALATVDASGYPGIDDVVVDIADSVDREGDSDDVRELRQRTFLNMQSFFVMDARQGDPSAPTTPVSEMTDDELKDFAEWINETYEDPAYWELTEDVRAVAGAAGIARDRIE